MDNRKDIKWIGVNVYSEERAIGKTTIAMAIVKYLRSIGYNAIYSGYSQSHTKLIEEQIKRTVDDPPYVHEEVTVIIEDKH